MMPDEAPVRIALVHALAESLEPIHAAFARHWPEAFHIDLLDTSLAIDRAHRGRLDAAMEARFATLADYAAGSLGLGGQAKAMLFTCSAFGPAIDAVKPRLSIPVMRPNEAAFAEALALGDDIGLVVTFAPSAQSLAEEMRAMAAELGREIRLHVVMVEGALTALKEGDGARHDALVAQAVARMPPVSVLVLGQFSLARAAETLARQHDIPILTTPDCAVLALRRRVEVKDRG